MIRSDGGGIGEGRRCPDCLLPFLHLYLPGSVVGAGGCSSPVLWREVALSWREDPEAMQRLHCEERHTEDLRDSVQVQAGSVRGNTPEGPGGFFTPR